MTNYILAFGFIIFGIYFVRDTYKKSAVLFSTDLKGYIAGIGFISVGIMSFFGVFDILKVLTLIWNAI
jgi:hypothetical protein